MSVPPATLAVAAAIALALAAADWVAVARADRRLERVAKPAVMLALIAGVVLTGPAGSGPAAMPGWALLLLGLAASLAGDVLMLPPRRFVPGLAAFLVAQVAYLVRLGLEPGIAALSPLAAVVVFAAVVLGQPVLRGARAAGFALPVAVYLVAITAMAVLAVGTGDAVAAAGALLFVASDAILARDRFVAPAPPGSVRNRLAIMVTYHLAQVLLVLALAR